MKVLLSGASGLIGSALSKALKERGDAVTRLVRKEWSSEPGEILWDPGPGYIERGKLEDLDAAVHLSGENVGSGRWTERKKGEIIESRTCTTKLLCRTFSELDTPPKTWVCASATGYYGNCGDRKLDEDEPCGETFLAEVCRQWEEASHPARNKGIRVLNTRFGVVLGGKRSALAKMLLPFRLGLGGPIGPGTQYMAWLTLDDAVRAILYALDTPSLDGPVNVVSPNPVRNREFVASLGRALNRPAVLPFPAFAARLLLGEMADDLLLASQRAVPRKLQEAGFTFDHPDLDEALRHVLEGM
ncbi:MAG TPA: TIGR01777 family oxidoreductase [Candidatus Hydrogenedentes bacterium]|nr:TIGR01777 family oxidoreductase [Candidatus Hydrogenedentota bacterium]HQE82832.1 TIGR01777 family oxidoreductase [Candidatus Hydrogenedentota bacterium]HQH52881.1 TIGR01777 family oxidoreductase [Candidatus Hydrogenedentota bacterium]HQM47561.1 TIGR01777 family oxidoreductase [Candidatus Hydrogenedentota bacterium]